MGVLRGGVGVVAGPMGVLLEVNRSLSWTYSTTLLGMTAILTPGDCSTNQSEGSYPVLVFLST